MATFGAFFILLFTMLFPALVPMFTSFIFGGLGF